MTILFKSVGFEWPDGHSVFKNIDLSLDSRGKFGLVGANGSGKSTLARLLHGDLAPSAGSIRKHVRVSFFAQFEEPPASFVAEHLSDLWVNATSSDLETIQALQEGIDFGAPCRVLSGGEWTRVRLLKLLSTGADFLILDEPTNNLDRDAREVVRAFVRLTGRGLLVISHDRELLEEVDSILELSNRGLSVYGGNWTFYEGEKERERTRSRERLERAENERDRAIHERTEKLEGQSKRMRNAKRSSPKQGLPKILLGARKRRAEKTLGKLQTLADIEVDARSRSVRQAFDNLKVEQRIYADFPETAIPSAKLVFEARDFNFTFEGAERPLWKRDISFVMKGSARICISGPNGSGKTTFLELMAGSHRPEGTVQGDLKMGGIQFGMIDQRARLLDAEKTIFENVYSSSVKSPVEVRNLLAQFLFPGVRADQLVSTLSGGETFRASLAKILISDPAPQLLILDEPTNHLDIVNLEFLEEALSRFEGAILVVSHDVTFLERIGITDELKLF